MPEPLVLINLPVINFDQPTYLGTLFKNKVSRQLCFQLLPSFFRIICAFTLSHKAYLLPNKPAKCSLMLLIRTFFF